MGGGHVSDEALAGSGAKPLGPSDPRELGGYPLLGVLGGGGMGIVYLGVDMRDPSPGTRPRYLAIKQILPVLADEPGFRQRFGHELENLARLPAGLSARLVSADLDEPRPWLATEYVPGVTLAQAVFLLGGGLPESDIWLLLHEAAQSLSTMHALGLIHRDLKPSNVMLTQNGLKVIDFGVARAGDQSTVTQAGQVVGTPGFMAPEQATGGGLLTSAVDVFALGCLLGYAAIGRSPFGESSALEVLFRIVNQDPELDPMRQTHPELAEVAASCLVKEPDDRPLAAALATKAAGRLPTRTELTATPGTTSVWPEEIGELLKRRVAFAATAANVAAQIRAQATVRPEPPAVTPPLPLPPTAPYTQTDPASGPRPPMPEQGRRPEDPRPVPIRTSVWHRTVIAAVLVCLLAVVGLLIRLGEATAKSNDARHAGSTSGTGRASPAAADPSATSPDPSGASPDPSATMADPSTASAAARPSGDASTAAAGFDPDSMNATTTDPVPLTGAAMLPRTVAGYEGAEYPLVSSSTTSCTAGGWSSNVQQVLASNGCGPALTADYVGPGASASAGEIMLSEVIIPFSDSTTASQVAQDLVDIRSGSAPWYFALYCPPSGPGSNLCGGGAWAGGGGNTYVTSQYRYLIEVTADYVTPGVPADEWTWMDPGELARASGPAYYISTN